MSRTTTHITPADEGRRMSLAEFDLAEARQGHLYELSRGRVSVVDVPNTFHFAQVDEIREQLSGYRRANSGKIYRIGTGSECKILLPDAESERHPDLAVYKTPPPDEDVWSTWVPELVIEVVSPNSADRDYNEKPAEYLSFGVAEYWVIDAARGEGGEALLHRRRAGKWAHIVMRPPQRCTTRQLPGFELDLTAVFAAARGAGA
jgi:Uma2 family endonuclease